jgi:hypothetical protein
MQFLDQLKLGWEALSRVEAEMRADREVSSFTRRERFAADFTGTEPASAGSPAQWMVSGPSLEGLIREIGVLPPFSVIVGACEDRAHLFLDLTDPRPGSMIILGAQGSGKTHLLQSILASACWLNPARRVRLGVITPDVSEMVFAASQPHTYKVITAESSEAADFLLELAELVEHRRASRVSGEAILVAIDHLPEFASALDDDLVDQLRWIIETGPDVRVWVFATAQLDQLDDLAPEILDAFGTRVVGRLEKPEQAAQLCGIETATPGNLLHGQQFGIVFGEDWVPFWIPIVHPPRMSARYPSYDSRRPYEDRNAVVR